MKVTPGFRYESEMTHLAAAACARWWPRGLQHDFVASEIVGPDAVADLVGIRFDQRRMAAREAQDIAPVIDALALRAIEVCRQRVLSTNELAAACGVSASGMRRALAIAVEANALVRHGRGRYSCHPAWGPVGARLVAVELKLKNWRAAFQQADAYARWANATWVLLARTPPAEAKFEAAANGLGLAVLGTDGNIERLVRPRAVRWPRTRWAALWASEQILVRAVSAGYRGDASRRPAQTLRAAPATLASGPVASLQST